MEPTKASMHTKTLIDHILTNSLEKVIQIGVTEMELLKTPPLKLSEHYEISLKLMKNYSDKVVMKKLRPKNFLTT